MPFLKSLKSFFNKDSYDFIRPDINIYNFHPQLPVFLALNGVFLNNRTSRLRFIWPVFNMMVTIAGLILEVMQILHGIAIEDYSYASECFSYLMMLGTAPSVYIGMICRNRLAVRLVDKMNADFNYICVLARKHKKVFMDGQLVIWKWCYLWMTLISITASLYVLNVGVLLIYQSIFATQTEDTIRPLIFPLWFPDSDSHQSPLYEILMGTEVYMCFLVVQAFGSHVYTLFHFLLHYYTIMDLIILDLEMVFEGLDERVAALARTHPERRYTQGILNSRMKRILTWHNDVFKAIRLIEELVSAPMLYQMMFTSFSLCVMMYQIAGQLNDGNFDYVFMASAISTCVQFWIPCYLGTLIRNKGYAVGDACWNTGWEATSLGRLVKTDFVTLILRSQRPLLIRFPGFGTLQLETFSAGYAVGDACWNTGWEATSLGRLVKTDFVTLILRSQRPLLIRFPGFGTLQLETFSAVMRKSYSYFNMLRQSLKGN